MTPKAEAVSKTDPVSTPRSALASEELIDLHRKLIEKEKAVVDLEEKLATLKQKRAEDKSKLKEVEKLKMQNQQVCFSRQIYFLIFQVINNFLKVNLALYTSHQHRVFRMLSRNILLRTYTG